MAEAGLAVLPALLQPETDLREAELLQLEQAGITAVLSLLSAR